MDFLDLLQKINNMLYNVLGLNDLTLELQVYINTQRNKRDIHDPTEVVYVDENNKEFVQ